MTQKRAFTLIELLVVISIIALLVGILLPALSAARKTAQKLKNTTQVRGIHQGMVIFARGNEGFYPGVDDPDKIDSYEVFADERTIQTYTTGRQWAGNHSGARFCIMLEQNLFVGSYAISPGEIDTRIETWRGVDRGGSYSDFSKPSVFVSSYALATIADESEGPGRWMDRFMSWTDSADSRSLVISDRLIQTPTFDRSATDTFRSVWSKNSGGGDWNGSLGFNDGHVTRSTEAVIENTRYGDVTNTVDNIFESYATDPLITDVEKKYSNAVMTCQGRFTPAFSPASDKK